jgi:subtilisin family serine protease
MRPSRPVYSGSALISTLIVIWTVAASAAPAPFPDDQSATAFERIFAEQPKRVVAGLIEIQLTEAALAPGLVARERLTGHESLDAALAGRGLSDLSGIFFQDMPERSRFDDFRDRFFVAEIARETDIESACRELMALPEVATAWPVLRLPALRDPVNIVTPNDPNFPAQYYLATNGGLGTLRAKGAWGHSLGDSSIVVAVCDTGVDLDHPDLAGNGPSYLDGNLYTDWVEYNGPSFTDDDGNGYMDDWRGWDFVHVGDNDYPGEDYLNPDNDPDDFEGHGTLCAGCVSAISDNGTGIASIGWNVRILPVRIGFAVEDQNGDMTGVTYSTYQASAFNYARVKGAQVINLSYGSSYTPSLLSAVNACWSAGVVMVVAAGNDASSTADYLAQTNKCVDVAATDINDGKADFSNFGSWVDVCAPGVSILTTAIDGYGNTQGTSFSAPITAGLLAQLYLTRHSGVTSSANAADIVAELTASCDNIDALNPGYAGLLGAGRINGFQALGGGSFFAFPEEFDDFQEALDFVLEGDSIAVRSSVDATVSLINPVVDLAILGGWSEDYESRDPAGAPATLRGNGLQPLFVFNTASVGPACIVEGFELRDGGGGAGYFPDLGTYGGAMLVSGGSPTLSHLDFLDSDLSDEDQSGGGGLFIAGVDLTLANCDFEGNSAVQGGGLGVYDCTVTLQDCDFLGNQASQTLSPDRRGGALHLTSATVLGQGLRFVGNSADDEGGAIFVDASSNLDLDDLEAQLNLAGSGGFLLTEGTADLDLGSFTDNSAPAGGGLALVRGQLTLTGSDCIGNGDPVATNFGGSLYGEAGSQIMVRNCRFIGEEVALQGAVLYGSSCSGEFINNSVDGIQNPILGSTIALSNSGLDIRNNQFTNIVGGPPLFANGAPLPTAAYNNFFGNGGTGNYAGFASSGGDSEVNPLYADLALGDLRLLLDSPSLDAGDPALLDPDGGRSDIGAFGGPGALPLRPDSPANLVVVTELRSWWVDLDWDDSPEGDLAGYAIYRDTVSGFQPTADNRVALTVSGASEYMDEVPDGVTDFYYKVGAYDLDGYGSGHSNEASGVGIEETPADELLPTAFALHGAFPNPFNPRTTLRFALPRETRPRLRIVAVDGRIIRDLDLGLLPAGEQSWTWDGRDDTGRTAAAGVYQALIEAAEWNDHLKLTLLK